MPQESSRRSAEAETRRALPQWQDQLQRAEEQLRQLSQQLRDKDAMLAEQRGEGDGSSGCCRIVCTTVMTDGILIRIQLVRVRSLSLQFARKVLLA